MPASSSLKPHKVMSRAASSRAAWCLNVPPELSDTGKRQRLFFDTEREAKVTSERLKARVDNFGGSLQTMSAQRIAEAGEAYRLLEPLSVGLLDAVRDYVKRHVERSASKPWRAVYDEYLALPKTRSAKYARDLRQVREAMKEFDNVLVLEITPPAIDESLARYAPSTRNSLLRILRAIFNLAIRRGYLVENPVSRLDFAQRLRREVQIFTNKQVDEMLKAALCDDPDLLPFLVLGVFAGIRPEGELSRLTWENVDLRERVVTIPPEISKTNRRRFVDLSDNAVAWLQTFIELRGIQSGRVVPFTAAVLRERRRENRKAAGIKKWIQQGLRHTYCTNWLAFHKDVNKLVLQSGHDSVETMWRNYHRGATEADAQKFWNIQPPTLARNIVPMAGAV